MSRNRRPRHLPIIATFIVALMLTVAPLSDSLEAFRPDWIVLVVIYWAMMLPRNYSVGVAWLLGIVLDVAQGTLLGQHALALCVIAYITVKFHLLLRVFPISQLTATVFVLLAVYQFLLFWINGVVGVSASAAYYWGPVLTGTIVWPLLSIFMSGIHYRTRM